MKNAAILPPEWLSKSAIYQINPRTFSSEGTLNAITSELPFLRSLGFNIVYLCPIFKEDDCADVSTWSPRQITSKTENPKNMYRMNDYFEIDEEYGTMDDLKALVNKAHALNMRVILDLVYAHIGPNASIIQRHPEFVQQNADGSFICTQWNFPALDFRSEGLREYLYCNMTYYVSVIDVDGFRCDVGDAVPIDFWKEARTRIQRVKNDAILINEGYLYEYMTVAFDSCYCFEWHELLRKIYCGEESASTLKSFSEDIVKKLPLCARLLRDIDNHDTASDWDGRTETVATHDGMEQIEVLNYLIDGIPMVYAGNEIACEARHNMFANRFHKGNYEFTDRGAKSTPQAIRRQEIIKALNAIKNESDILCYGETAWIDTSANESIIAFKRTLKNEEIIFIGNAKNSNCEIDVTDFYCGQKIMLCNGEHKIENGVLYLKPREYVAFRK